MGKIDERGAAAGKDEGEAVVPHQPRRRGALAHPLRQRFARRQVRLVDALEHHHLRAVDRAFIRFAARQPRLPGERGIAARIDEALRRHGEIAEARGQIEAARRAVHAIVTPRRMAPSTTVMPAWRTASLTQRDSATSSYMTTDGHRAAAVVQRALGAEFAQDVVGDAVGELAACAPLAKRPQNVPMIELTACPPNAGRASTSATLRPSRAASSAAETPAMPAPSTQISTSSAGKRWPRVLRTTRVAVRTAAGPAMRVTRT